MCIWHSVNDELLPGAEHCMSQRLQTSGWAIVGVENVMVAGEGSCAASGIQNGARARGDTGCGGLVPQVHHLSRTLGVVVKHFY